MRLLFVLLFAACGDKTPPAPAAAPVEAAAAPVEAAPEAPPEPPPPPPEVINASLNVTITYANGTSKTGKVKRIERSDDLFGEKGEWHTDAKKLTMNGDAGSASKDFAWTDVKTITIVPGKIPAEIDCTYESDYQPWMYDCTLKTTATAILKDNSKWVVGTRNKWKMTFEDNESVEFWLFKHPAREQDEKVVDLDTKDAENLALYTKLQNRLREEVKGNLVVKVTVNGG